MKFETKNTKFSLKLDTKYEIKMKTWTTIEEK